MNKIFLCLLLAVCILGMVLIMLNDRLRKPDTPPVTPSIVAPVVPPDSPASPPAVSRVETPALTDVSPTPLTPDAPPAVVRPENSVPPLPRGSMADLPPATKPRASEQNRHAEQPSVPKPVADAKPAPAKPAPKPDSGKAAPKPESPKPAAKPDTPAPQAKSAAHDREQAATQPHTLTKFVVLVREKGATVRLVSETPMTYKSMALPDPDRMVVDLEGAWQIKAPGVPRNDVVTNVRLGKEASKTRIVIDLSQKVRSRVILSPDRKTLDIRLDQ